MFSFHDQCKIVKAFSIPNSTLASSSFFFPVKCKPRFDFSAATAPFYIVPMDTPRRIDFDVLYKSKCKRKTSTNLHVILTNFSDVISMGKNLTFFRRVFLKIIIMDKKSMSFWHISFISFRHTLFHANSMNEKASTSRCTFSDKTSMGKSSMPFWFTFLDRFPVDKKSRLFRVFFHVISMENWCNFTVLILMSFWKTKNRGRFDISFW